MTAPYCDSLTEIKKLAQAMDRAQVDNYDMIIPASLKKKEGKVIIIQAVRRGAARAIHAAVSVDGQGKDLLLHVTLTWRPGVQAARCIGEGRTGDLSMDERLMYDKAREILPEDICRWPEIKRERYIHDWLCTHVSYRSAADMSDDNIYDRNCSALGALLDGQANCQGYSDAFYFLGTLAGLKVNIQSGVAGGNHAWNVIRIEGKWYILDVTFDCSASLVKGIPLYFKFNVGLDLEGPYRQWDRIAASAPIAEKSEQWFYHQKEWGVVSDDLDVVARYCVQHAQMGEQVNCAAYTGKALQKGEALEAVRKQSAGLPYDKMAVSSNSYDGITYIVVRWFRKGEASEKK